MKLGETVYFKLLNIHIYHCTPIYSERRDIKNGWQLRDLKFSQR
jgi:hypothetical protein